MADHYARIAAYRIPEGSPEWFELGERYGYPNSPHGNRAGSWRVILERAEAAGDAEVVDHARRAIAQCEAEFATASEDPIKRYIRVQQQSDAAMPGLKPDYFNDPDNG